ncbi:peptidylprolyl isomerase [Salibacterium salarium]|uniref:peptidylprolyl isomerase n=1 Tax=Salibacterium salarium TaxID=284579 RepID=A0A3R9QKF8_9BACI|nr:SurA N-terminal domain-containing protein [Salibacterium salarium]RSL32734.1 peptidylprolyl isomerase [Salibacterium salarium]
MSKKNILSIALAVSMTMIAACGDEDASDEKENNEQQEESNEENTNEDGENEGETAQETEMPEPDLSEIPDVVAQVNEEDISKDEFETSYERQFQQAALQAQMTGEDLDQNQLKEQVAESMIVTELLVQEADNRDIEASQEDIDNTLNELVELNQLESQDEFISTIKEQQGMNEEEIMTEVKTQVKVDQLIDEESGDTEPTEEELKEAYDQLTAQQEQMSGENEKEIEIPPFEEVKSDLEDQLRSQKETKQMQSLVEELREKEDVTINL